MRSFAEFLENLHQPVDNQNDINDIEVDEKTITNHDVDDVETFKNIYDDAFKKQQYIFRVGDPLKLKIGIKIINNKGINCYFVRLVQILQYLPQVDSKKEKMNQRLREIVKAYKEEYANKFKDLYYFPDIDELRIVILDKNTPCQAKNSVLDTSYYYYGGKEFPEVWGVMHPSKWKKLKLPYGWDYSKAIKYVSKKI